MLLRLTVGCSAILPSLLAFVAPGGPPQPPWWVDVIAVPVGLALLIGFLTPIASVCAAIGNAAIAILCYAVTVTGPNPKLWSVLYLAAMSLALLMLGPGAFSLDARLFGRREIIIPEGRRPPGM